MSIEDYIKENKSEFDCKVLPEGHRERFMQSLKASGFVKNDIHVVESSKNRRLTMLTIWNSIAAAAVVTAAIIISGFNIGNEITTKLPATADSRLVELRNAYDQKVNDAIVNLEDVMKNADDSTRMQINGVINSLIDMSDVFAQIAPLPEEKQVAIAEQIYDNKLKTIERITEKVDK